MSDERSVINDSVRPESDMVVRVYMSTDVGGDDRFAPGVTDCVSLGSVTDMDSHGEVLWECLSGGEGSYVACWSDWRSVLQLVALMLRLPEFPHTGDSNFGLRILMLRGDCSDVGTNCNMAFSALTMCFQAWMPDIGPQMFAHTLPALPFQQEWPVRKELAGKEGSSGASPEGVARLRGCAVARKSPPARKSWSACKTGAI